MINVGRRCAMYPHKHWDICGRRTRAVARANSTTPSRELNSAQATSHRKSRSIVCWSLSSQINFDQFGWGNALFITILSIHPNIQSESKWWWSQLSQLLKLDTTNQLVVFCRIHRTRCDNYYCSWAILQKSCANRKWSTNNNSTFWSKIQESN